MAKNKKFVNREISWLHFNERVLQEAMDENNPLIERLKFLGIFSNNRDEFFRVRVASLKRMVQYGKTKIIGAGMTPQNVLAEIEKIVEDQEKKFNDTFQKIVAELEKQNVFFLEDDQLNENQGAYVRYYFNTEVIQNLFPIMLKRLRNPDTLEDNAIYLAVHLSDSKNEKEDDYALVMIPCENLSRFVILPKTDNQYSVILLDDVIRYNLDEIFAPFGYDTYDSYTIKITRDAELDIDNDISKTFIELMADSVKKRKRGVPIRFVYDNNIPEVLLKRLLKKLAIKSTDNLRGGGRYHNFKDFMSFPKIGSPDLIYPKIEPLANKRIKNKKSIIEAIKEKDILLSYPYQSFQNLVDLLREASIDPKVRAIKMTFYRAARDSNVINSLINAVRNGKNVTVFLEIQARFDEKANIYWTGKLKEEGVKIIQSLPGHKVHSKLLSIRRKENGKNVYYSNISTGNYNESTAKVYADDSLLTADQGIGQEVNQIFHLFESPYNPPRFKHLLVAPYHLRNKFISLINSEIKNAKEGKEAWIILKLNNIVDERIVNKLYQASNAGVKIDIVCRGICVLIPQIPGLSANIRVVSIVDKFLEHSRYHIFASNGDPKFYLTSADWMVRNFDHRFETACPVYDKDLQKTILHMLNIQLNDNVKARKVNAKNTNEYVGKSNAEKSCRSQFEIYSYLKNELDN